MCLNKRKLQVGQVGIVVILIMVVLLTVGLSIASRSTKEVDISSEGQRASSAFYKAETGVEEALARIHKKEKGEDENLNPVSTDDLQYNIDSFSSLEIPILHGHSATLPLTNKDDFSIEWSKTDCSNLNNTAALLITVFLTKNSQTIVEHYAVDGCNSLRNNNFIANNSGSSLNYKFKHTIGQLQNDSKVPLFAIITPLYANTDVRVNGLPSTAQYIIKSSGRDKADDLETKTIMLDRTLPSVPSFMNYSLVSGGSITK